MNKGSFPLRKQLNIKTREKTIERNIEKISNCSLLSFLLLFTSTKFLQRKRHRKIQFLQTELTSAVTTQKFSQLQGFEPFDHALFCSRLISSVLQLSKQVWNRSTIKIENILFCKYWSWIIAIFITKREQKFFESVSEGVARILRRSSKVKTKAVNINELLKFAFLYCC